MENPILHYLRRKNMETVKTLKRGEYRTSLLTYRKLLRMVQEIGLK